MHNSQATPFYLRFGITIITIAFLCLGVYFGRNILLPFFFGILLAVLLLPVTKWLQRLRLGRVVSISIAIFLAMIVIASIIYYLSSQVSRFIADFPALQERFNEIVSETQHWIDDHFDIGIREQREYLDQTAEKMKTDGPLIVSQTFMTITGAISYLVFLPIYAFLILYHKDLIKQFLIDVSKRRDKDKVIEVLHESQHIAQQYIAGLLIEVCIVFAMNTIGFMIIGIDYMIFLALLSAFLNIVPYVGMLVANAISILVTIMTAENPFDAIWVPVVLSSVQLVDNNILMPLIVGNKVRLNAIAIILGVLIAGSLAGVAGMFLAIPSIAVLKIIFERVDQLRPWAILMGDETSLEEKTQSPVSRALERVKAKRRSKEKSSH